MAASSGEVDLRAAVERARADRVARTDRAERRQQAEQRYLAQDLDRARRRQAAGPDLDHDRD